MYGISERVIPKKRWANMMVSDKVMLGINYENMGIKGRIGLG